MTQLKPDCRAFGIVEEKDSLDAGKFIFITDQFFCKGLG
jgi:hypothetical protein